MHRLIAARPARLVGTLALTQVLGWGTTFYLPSVIGSAVALQLDLSIAAVFAGVSLMMMVGGLVSPAVAGRIRTRGASAVMAEGSILFAAGLFALALSQGFISYFAAWALLGLAFPFALNLGAYSAMAAEFPTGATTAMTLLGFATGLTPAIAWPALSWLHDTFGWRPTCAIGGLIHLLVCAPLHLGLQVRPQDPGAEVRRADDDGRAAPTQALFAALAVGLVLNGFLMTGFQLHLLGLLEKLGASPGEALKVGSLLGIAQVAARAAMLGLARTTPAVRIGVAGACLFCLAFPLLALGSPSLTVLGLGVVVIGAAMGVSYPMRATIPYELFGASRFPAVYARLSVFQNAASAVAPIVVAGAVTRWGAQAALGLAEIVAVSSLAALAWVARRSGVRAQP